MLWKGRRQSENVLTSRGLPRAPLALGGGGTLLLLVVILCLGGNPLALFQGQDGGLPAEPGQELDPRQQELREFVAVVLADTEDIWHEQFRRIGRTYREPKLILFSDRVDSACGMASSAVGPFYCPEDERIYLDLEFFRELRSRFGAPGDFAQAYVIAHEVGHHVQRQLGMTEKVHSQKRWVTPAEYNRLSVRLELQADFYAGVWAHHAHKTKHVVEPGDIEEALRAANAIGDDRLQRQSRGYVVPDSFTHGTSEQRVRWFRKGFKSGDMRQGDTFSVRWEDL